MKSKAAFGDFAQVEIKETYPVQELQKKMILHAHVYRIKWMGEKYNSAGVFIDHCCQESIDKCDGFYPQKTNAPAGGRDPKNFLRMIYNGIPVDECPFCGAEIELKIEAKESRELWY